MHEVVEFCSDCKKCPVVVITDESVLIGEEDNVVALTHPEFKDLKQAIIDGRL